MTSSLQELLGVDSSGKHWEVGGYRLWQSTDAGIVLYMPMQPRVMQDELTGRYQANVTLLRRWQEGSYRTTGGSAMLTLDTAGQPGLQSMQQLAERWRVVLAHEGYAGDLVPRFQPLPQRNGKLRVSIPDSAGQPGGTAQGSASTDPSGMVLMNLTAEGADAWAAALKERRSVMGGVSYTYEYPQLLPAIEASVLLHGARVFTYLDGALEHTRDGVLYGTAAAIRSAWTDMVRAGVVEIRLPRDLPRETAESLPDLLATFGDQAREQLFDTLFVPFSAEDANAPAGPLYAFLWRARSDAADLTMSLRFEAWNWLQGSIESDLATLLQPLDATYVNTVFTEVSLPWSLAVDPAASLTSLAASVNFSDGHAPDAPVFGANGGAVQYTITTAHPEGVTVQYAARASYANRWPPLEVSGYATPAREGGRTVLQPGNWIRRHKFYMYVRQGQRILKPSEGSPDDYLVLNVNYEAAGLPAIRESARITTLTPMEFTYPVPPGKSPGKASFSALGLVGGRPVRTAEQPILSEDEDLFILVDGSSVQLVSRAAVLSESDGLAAHLLNDGARPVVRHNGQVATAEDTQDIDVELEVELIPQPTPISCWAASLAMVISARDRASYRPEDVAQAAGMNTTTGYGWNAIRRAVTTWGLHEAGPACATPAEWARWLNWYGPIWIVEIGAPYHAVVVAGIYGDGTPDGSTVIIYNPWPPQQGAVEYKTFVDFDLEFGLGAGADAQMVHA